MPEEIKSEIEIKKIIPIIGITIALLLGGVYEYSRDKTYICESRDLVMNCERFSDSGLRCYPNLIDTKGYRDCSEGWWKVEDYLEYYNLTIPMLIESKKVETITETIVKGDNVYRIKVVKVPEEKVIVQKTIYNCELINEEEYLCREWKFGQGEIGKEIIKSRGDVE